MRFLPHQGGVRIIFLFVSFSSCLSFKKSVELADTGLERDRMSFVLLKC